MKKILVSLISEQTIPNILVAAHYTPDEFWFVSTEKMEKERKVECIVNTLKLKELLPASENIQKVIVDQDSLADCINNIESLIEKAGSEVEYIVNITGGNKVMALAAYEVFREIGRGVTIDYIPIGKNELVQIFPRKIPLKISDISERLNLEEYLCSYGFRIQNKNKAEEIKTKAFSRKESAKKILCNYERLKEVLGFLYKSLKDKRNMKNYRLSETFDNDIAAIEKEILNGYGFEIKDRLISKDLTKDDIVYLTGGWFEEYVYSEVYSLVKEGMLDDATMNITIENSNNVTNELDIAFVKNNIFYYIECKTLSEDEKDIIRDEVYKKGAISTLFGKGEKRAMICTTNSQINESLTKRAKDYDIEILTIEEARNLKNRLKARFG